MTTTHNAAPADPVLLALLAVMALGWALLTLARLLLIPAAALLLVLLGWRPAPQPQPVAPAAVEASPALIAASERPALPPAAVPPSPPDLARLRVVELRALARAAGLPQLARSGRRAQLLEALAAAPC